MTDCVFLLIVFSFALLYNGNGRDIMKFEIKPSEPIHNSINRTIRFPRRVFNRLMELTEQNNISFNKLVNQCVQYALDDLEEPKRKR